MKLFFIQDGLYAGGAEKSHLELISRFSDEIDLIFVYLYPKHDLREQYERSDIKLVFLDIPETYHFPLAIYRLVGLIKMEKPDLLVSSLWRADIITRMASIFTGIPLVGTLVNDSYAPIAWTNKKGLKYKIVYWLDKWTAQVPVHWIANAKSLADSHVKTLKIDRNKISVVYRGRAAPYIVHDSGDVSRLLSGERTRYEDEAISKDNEKSSDEETASPDSIGIAMTGQIRNFISYGRLLERKGFQDAINAFSEVIKKYPACTLTIYGEGPYRSELESLITSLDLTDHVKLPGKFGFGGSYSYRKENEIVTPSLRSARNDATTILLENDCFIFPSWYEGFSGALVEAMMAGIPIIASDIPMNLEAVSARESALVYPVGQVEALTEKMIWAISHEEEMKSMGEKARQKAKNNFDIEVISKDYEKVLHSVFARIAV
ncbi:glycosyltransferase [Algoriphagus sediminis]|uniref:Glycosyltransferase n=1 Tax=Algoriphagus sediminis TaxID=3057113 RepID=A0ABT7YDU6_9BACT|nr:glycosyltransferase [Algoriphagus sediminis]MDN3204691.1 glycosyltransferase [Algoriphagus sediminis]